MNLITGRAGAAHITPRQDAMWHQGLVEMESCIFDAYENFAAEIITNNEVRIRSGVGMLQGRFFCIEPNTYDSAEIANGNQGEKRIDLIVARIAVDATANTQSASIVVIQGTPAAENPTAPEAVTGDLDAGDLIADYPLVEVFIDNITIESATPIFSAGWLSTPDTRQSINYIGTNPIASLEDDTPENWKALGTSIAYFNAIRLNNQPEAYGFVENKVGGSNGNLVFQTFRSMNGNSPVWHRSGNANGWHSGSANWVKQLDENNGIQMKKLWQNASPTSSFATQNISITNLSDYDMLAIFYARNTSDYGDGNMKLMKFDSIASLDFPIKIVGSTDNNMYARNVWTTDQNTLSFGGAYKRTVSGSSTTSDDTTCIPIEIYGIKGVQ